MAAKAKSTTAAEAKPADAKAAGAKRAEATPAGAKAHGARASRTAPAARERPAGVERTYRAAMRAVLEAAITAERWRAIVECAAAQAEEGDRHARAFLAPWVVGRVPDEVKVQQSGNVVIEVVYGGASAGSARAGKAERPSGE